MERNILWQKRKHPFHGQGTFTFPNVGKYKGKWKDGKPHGQGTYTYPDGTKYVGEWKNGKMWIGTYTFPDGEKWVGMFKYIHDFPTIWNGIGYDKDGDITGKYVNGEMIYQ